jgi:hypothetical protein
VVEVEHLTHHPVDLVLLEYLVVQVEVLELVIVEDLLLEDQEIVRQLVHHKVILEDHLEDLLYLHMVEVVEVVLGEREELLQLQIQEVMEDQVLLTQYRIHQ